MSYLIFEFLLNWSHFFQNSSVLDEPFNTWIILDTFAERFAEHQVRHVGHVI